MLARLSGVKHFRDVPDRLMQTTSSCNVFQLAGGRSMRKVSATLAVLAVLSAGVGTYVFDFFSAFTSMG